MDANIEPKLAPPGAGLPAAELFIARLLFKRGLRSGSRESFIEAFQREREAVDKLVSGIDPQLADRRVLIDRVRGLEDSSRFWSVWMTLDHLRIVHRGIAKTINDLARGVIPPGKADTAAVKPSPNVTEAVVSEFEHSCDSVIKAIMAASELKTPIRFPHPWFGPLDAYGWAGLAGNHMRIHREQIERISAQLPARQPTSSFAPE